MKYLKPMFNKRIIVRSETDENEGEKNDSPYSERPSFLEKINNRIYFYSEIDRSDILQLNRNIRELGAELLAMQKNWDMEEPMNIYLHINSYGGSVIDAFSVIDEIRRSPVPVVSVIDGAAASAATMISICCHRRQINKHAVMLIHQLSSFHAGKFSELEDAMSNSTQFMEMIKQIYIEKAKFPPEILSELLKHDLWLNAEKCLEYGLVDKII